MLVIDGSAIGLRKALLRKKAIAFAGRMSQATGLLPAP